MRITRLLAGFLLAMSSCAGAGAPTNQERTSPPGIQPNAGPPDSSPPTTEKSASESEVAVGVDPLPEPPPQAACIVHGEGSLWLRPTGGGPDAFVSGKVALYLEVGPLSDAFVRIETTSFTVVGTVATHNLQLGAGRPILIDGYALFIESFTAHHADVLRIAVDDEGLLLFPNWANETRGRLRGHSPDPKERIKCNELSWGLDLAGFEPLGKPIGTATMVGGDPVPVAGKAGGDALADLDPGIVGSLLVFEETKRRARIYAPMAGLSAGAWGVLGWVEKRRLKIEKAPRPSKSKAATSGTAADAARAAARAGAAGSSTSGGMGTLEAREPDEHRQVRCARPLEVWSRADGATESAVVGQSHSGASFYAGDPNPEGWVRVSDDRARVRSSDLWVRGDDLSKCDAATDSAVP